MLNIQTIHHVSLPVEDLDRSKQFYSDILGLKETERPPFDFLGAWYQLGDKQLHLIVHPKSTFRTDKEVDSRDIHFAIRVSSYTEARDYLHSKGYNPEAKDLLLYMKESPKGTAGFPQIYIMDPDRNVIEINADRLGR